ncbi:hypothetical protein [Anaerovibrio slackiae]|uniref:hypothetical protein n=1 Tax=Anaerovibrio slackiae TaxID=2652309 RepID=UPI0038683534
MKVTIELDNTDLKEVTAARALVLLMAGKELGASVQPAVVMADKPQDNTPAEHIHEQEPEPPAKISRPAKGRKTLETLKVELRKFFLAHPEKGQEIQLKCQQLGISNASVATKEQLEVLLTELEAEQGRW